VKKVLPVILLVFLHVNMNLFAQDNSNEEASHSFMAVGLGVEWNMDSRDNFAGGGVFNIDFNLPSVPLALGITAAFSSNFYDNFVIETSALFRWYFLGKNHSGLFAQADAGAVFIFESEEMTPLFMGGLRGGFRLPLGDMFFIEPYGRVGYPFMFGVGVLAGIMFS